MQDNRSRRRRVRAAAFGCFVFISVILVMWWVRSRPETTDQRIRRLLAGPANFVVDSVAESQIRTFCGDCHRVPLPESFPRDAWHHKVLRGYQYYGQSKRNDLSPPPMHVTVEYYRSRAPAQVLFPEPPEAETALLAQFRVEKLQSQENPEVPPGIAHLRWVSLQPDAQPVLLTCDMRRGEVATLDLRSPLRSCRILAKLDNPCHLEACDLNGDLAVDLVVADLGSSMAVDHDRGRVLWLKPEGDSGGFREVVLASGLGRVCDVRPADFDGDGDLDLLVAEFGHYRTGGIHLLRNEASPGRDPCFSSERIDSRPGAIHLPAFDFDGDGRLDFLALVSQEYEQIELFLNQGNMVFRPQTLWSAPDLSFGSSGIELVDLDGDGDQDILYTNGDSFDNSYATPWHGVQWLENLGGLRFKYHRLTDLAGAYCVKAGDIDLDGDLDLIVVAWLPQQRMPPNLALRPLPSIVCLEQTSPKVFARHTLEIGSPAYPVMELADFDGDGDLDFAVGTHVPNSLEVSHSLMIWWNGKISANR